MAVKRKSKRVEESKSISKPVVMTDENTLDPQEEKILDWILKAVVFFVLGWLALAILMVIGGYFHLWG
jgi:hypothetical protein